MRPPARIIATAISYLTICLGCMGGPAEESEGVRQKAPEEGVEAMGKEAVADAQSLRTALKGAKSSQEREALAKAFAERNDARSVQIASLLEKEERERPPGRRLTVEERVPAQAPAAVQEALRQQYKRLDELDALKESTKTLTPEARGRAYAQWSEASAGELEQARRTLSADLEGKSAREPAKALPAAPESLSAEGKAAWNQRNGMIADLDALKAGTKDATPEARSRAYTEWFEAHGAAMEQAQGKLQAAAEIQSGVSENPGR